VRHGSQQQPDRVKTDWKPRDASPLARERRRVRVAP